MWRSSSSCVCSAVIATAILANIEHLNAAAPGPLLKTAGPLPCAIIMGRIVALDPPGYVARSEATEDQRTGERETLCIQATTGSYVLRYEHHAAESHLSIDFVGRGELRIASQTTAAKVQFAQPLSGKMRLDIEASGERKCVEAATIWHLLLAEPRLCDQHLLPLLALLNPDWRLHEQRTALERQLLAGADEPRVISAAEVRELVARLGESSFAVRQAAYRELVSQGPGVLPHLAAIKPATLDAEQRARINDVRTTFAYASPDNTERIFAWLESDRDVWAALDRRADERVRTAAQQETGRLVR